MATLVNPELDFDCHYLAIRGFIPLSIHENSWFEVSGTPEQLEYDKAEVDEVMELLTECILKLSRQYKSNSVYLVGYSQGATLLYSYAPLAPDVIKGMVAFSGKLLYPTVGKNPGLPFFIGHGTLDGLISIQDIGQSKSYLEQKGLKVDLKTYRVPHVVSKQGRRDMATWLKALQEK